MKKWLWLLLLSSALSATDRLFHVIPHSHWDREWYLPFEQHRMRLVTLLDDVLDQCETNDAFYFLCDGQTIMIEDYLTIRPENKERVLAAVRNGKLSYGPQYILPDTYLADAESQVRNHLLAIREAQSLALTKATDQLEPPPFFLSIGYFPDTFGNTAQSPQLISEFGFTSCIVGRGFAPEQSGSAFYWESPDGSRVFTYQFPDWYCNGKELTADPTSLPSRIHRAQQDNFAHYLLMNGCDHQPVQKNLSSVLQALSLATAPDQWLISRPQKFLHCLKAEKKDWPTFHGEARNQGQRHGLGLEDVYSSRLYLKRANYQASHTLECYAEPLASLAYTAAATPYPQPFLDRAWKLLLQNQVHDDICGCSVDAVHQDMMGRFRQVQDLCHPIIQNSLEALMNHLALADLPDHRRALFVFNPTPYHRDEIITAQVDFPWPEPIQAITARAADGSLTPCCLLSQERAFAYQLPEDGFRVSYEVNRLHLQLAVSVPSFGYAVYRIAPGTADPRPGDVVTATPQSLENKFLRVHVQSDGRFTLLDKQRNTLYRDLGTYELRSDCGDEYNFHKLTAETPLRCAPGSGRADLVRSNELEATLCFSQTIDWTAELDQAKKVRLGLAALEIKTFMTLTSGEPLLKIRVEMNNHLRDYRLRVLLPTGLASSTITSEGDFGLDSRPVKPITGYQRDAYSLPQGVFSFFQSQGRTFLIANKGLTEIEPIVGDDGRVTASLTLLRCVGELGDWGFFPTPEAQCQGKQTAEFALLPADNQIPLRQVYAYSRPLHSVDTGRRTGSWPLSHSFMREWPETLILSAVKKAEMRPTLIVRGFNLSPQAVSMQIDLSEADQLFQTNLLEKRLNELTAGQMRVLPYKIFSVEATPKQ